APPPVPPKPALSQHEPAAVLPQQALFDPEIAELETGTARELLLGWTERGEAAQLGWVEGQLVLAASDGRRTAVRATAVALEAGRGPGRGGAAGAARSLAALDAPEIAARARRRMPPAAPAPPEFEPPSEPVPLLLAPEAAAILVDLLNRALFSSTAFRDPASPLRGRLGSLLFDRAITLVDDATDAGGLPFPCDLAGARKRPVELIREGVVLTPAVDGPLAVELGRPATPHFLSADESLAANLFLRPGGRSDEDLRREVGELGGLWVGSLGGIEVYPGGPRFRARAGGVRRIAGGELGEALPDLSWEDRLPDALSRVIGVGDRPLVMGAGEPLRLFLGGTSAPALALDLRGRGAALYPARG
ncbi:MAG TPA: metallopeptidase TldD-related protein, partial [Thermoanaerobaculia bacterium]